MIRRIIHFAFFGVVFAFPSCTAIGASFPGNARVEIDDPTGSLSWSEETKALTVSCWFKMSIPSGTTISDHMVILADRRTGAEDTDRYAYLICYGIYTGKIEFVTRGDSKETLTLVETPYLDRWYHVAVVRDGNQFNGYLDGRMVFSTSLTVGNTGNTDGASVGGWGNSKYFWGEIQEVAVYQEAVPPEVIVDRMFKDQPSWSTLICRDTISWVIQRTRRITTAILPRSRLRGRIRV